MIIVPSAVDAGLVETLFIGHFAGSFDGFLCRLSPYLLHGEFSLFVAHNEVCSRKVEEIDQLKALLFFHLKDNLKLEAKVEANREMLIEAYAQIHGLSKEEARKAWRNLAKVALDRLLNEARKTNPHLAGLLDDRSIEDVLPEE